MKIENCEAFLMHLDAYLDGETDAETAMEMEKHAAACDKCREEMNWRSSLLEMCAALDQDVTVPEECHAAWVQAVQSSGKQHRSHRSAAWMSGIAACLALWLGLTGFLRGNDVFSPDASAFQEKGAYVTEDAAYEMYAESEAMDTGISVRSLSANSGYSLSSDGQAEELTTGSFDQTREQKVIRSAYRSIESTAYDADLATLTDLVSEYEAYFESRNEHGRPLSQDGDGRTLSATLRVPTASLDNFLSSLVAVGTSVQRSESATDVSKDYFDAESRLSAQRAQLQRLQEMYAQAQNVDELLSIEERIAEVQYEIDRLESSLSGWDSLISYSTVSITLTEVAETDRFVTIETTLMDRIGKAFRESVNWLVGFFQDALVVLVLFAPYLLILAVLLTVVLLTVRLIRRKRRR